MLILLHPADYANHKPLIYRMLKGTPGAYLHFSGHNMLYFLDMLEQALAEQLELSLPALPLQPREAGQALADYLNQHAPLILVLGDYDHVTDETVHVFLAGMAERLQPGVDVVVSARVLQPSLLALAAPYSRLEPIDPSRMLVDYLHRQDGTYIVEVRALGAGQATINGRLLTRWDGVLPKNLFFYLVDRAMARREDIFETFWPNLGRNAATNVFHVTKRKVSELIGFDLTEYSAGFYRLADRVELHYDVALFVGAAQIGLSEEDTTAASRHLRDAVALHRGVFLNGLEAEWITRRRDELQGLFSDCLSALGRIRAQDGDYTRALGYYVRAFGQTPQREDILRQVMETYVMLGFPERALEIYQQFEEHMLAAGHFFIKTAPETRTLVNTVRAAMNEKNQA